MQQMHHGASVVKTAEYDYEDIPEDMWGVSIVVTVKDLTAALACELPAGRLLRLVIGYIGMITNLVLQIALLRWVNLYVVNSAVHTLQKDYAQFHREVFTPDGQFDEAKWRVWDGPYESLCNSSLTKLYFTSAIIFLWVALMLGEFKACRRLWASISKLPSLPSHLTWRDMVEETTDPEDSSIVTQYNVMALNVPVRIALYALVILPKFLVCLCLTYIGARWLTATESFADLILNALALEFIIGIDNVVYDNFFPQRMKDNIASTKFCTVHEPESPEQANRQMLIDYIRNLAFILTGLLFVYLYMNHLQQVIPGFQRDVHDHCTDWFWAQYTPKCNFGQTGCFPYGLEDTQGPYADVLRKAES